MIFFLLLAVMSLATVRTAAFNSKLPPYVESHREIKHAIQILKDNVISMDGNIPYLNDSRRSYAEVSYVIFEIANVLAHNCDEVNYDKNFQAFVNYALPKALGKAQKVVDTAKTFLHTLDEKTLNIQKLIDEVVTVADSDQIADALANKIITNDPKMYKLEAKVLLAAGASAIKFNEMQDTFNDVAKEILSHRYIIKGSQELKPVILLLVNALRQMYSTYVKC